jgi:hypothetical protein
LHSRAADRACGRACRVRAPPTAPNMISWLRYTATPANSRGQGGAGGGIRTHNPCPGAVFEFSACSMSPSVSVREGRKNPTLAGSTLCLRPTAFSSVGVSVGVTLVWLHRSVYRC